MPDRFRRNLTPLAQREERVCALSRLQAFAVVRGGIVDGRALRHDAARVHRGMAAVVVVLDVVQVDGLGDARHPVERSEEHTSELQSLMRISYAVFSLKKKKKQ